jgi:hypothetical protein
MSASEPPSPKLWPPAAAGNNALLFLLLSAANLQLTRLPFPRQRHRDALHGLFSLIFAGNLQAGRASPADRWEQYSTIVASIRSPSHHMPNATVRRAAMLAAAVIVARTTA